MKPVVAKPTVEEEDENEGPLSKNKARRMRKQLLHREDELRALNAVRGAAGDAAGEADCRSSRRLTTRRAAGGPRREDAGRADR